MNRREGHILNDLLDKGINEWALSLLLTTNHTGEKYGGKSGFKSTVA